MITSNGGARPNPTTIFHAFFVFVRYGTTLLTQEKYCLVYGRSTFLLKSEGNKFLHHMDLKDERTFIQSKLFNFNGKIIWYTYHSQRCPLCAHEHCHLCQISHADVKIESQANSFNYSTNAEIPKY